MVDPLVAVQEGSGGASPFASTFIAGYGQRSCLKAYHDLTEQAGWAIRPLRLVDPRYYHVDLTFCRLDERTALIVPDAFTPQGYRMLAQLVADPVVATTGEDAMFCANSIAVGRTVIIPVCTLRLGWLLKRRAPVQMTGTSTRARSYSIEEVTTWQVTR